jgi:hypothetical protein
MSERILMKFIVGQRVVKQGEDSRFEGQVVACFVKRDMKTLRYVVENDDGVLHIANERQLRLAMPIRAPAQLKSSHSEGRLRSGFLFRQKARATWWFKLKAKYLGVGFAAPAATNPSSPRPSPSACASIHWPPDRAAAASTPTEPAVTGLQSWQPGSL